jgi:hypothetical protein
MGKRPVKILAKLSGRAKGNEITRLLADKRRAFLVKIAAFLMARYRANELTPVDVSHLNGLLGKIGFSPSERRKLDLLNTGI